MRRALVHVVDQSVEHGHGVVDDALVARVGSVQQPAGEFQLGVKHRALGDPRVVALAGRRVRGHGGFSGRPAGGEQPVQVTSRVTHAQGGPAENAGDGILLDQK